MEDFILFIAFVFGVLQIILFFKLWAMTNDVRKIKTMMENQQAPNVTSDKKVAVEAQVDGAIKPGDNVTVIATGKRLTVEMVEGDTAFCVGIGTNGYVRYKLDKLQRA